MRDQLVAGVSVLENVPESEKDWHPRSNNQVLDLVHPSLFCLVYGRTQAYPPIDELPSENRTTSDLQVVEGPQEWVANTLTSDHPRLKPIGDYAVSKKFAWIPTDFSISSDGENATALGYINNLHPSHAGLYDVIAKLVARFTHLWDRVLTDLHPANNLLKRISEEYSYPGGYDEGAPDYLEGESEEEHEVRYLEWHRAREINLPTVPQRGYREHEGLLAKRAIQYSIQGRECQVIVKLANIHLVRLYIFVSIQ